MFLSIPHSFLTMNLYVLELAVETWYRLSIPNLKIWHWELLAHCGRKCHIWPHVLVKFCVCQRHMCIKPLLGYLNHTWNINEFHALTWVKDIVLRIWEHHHPIPRPWQNPNSNCWPRAFTIKDAQSEYRSLLPKQKVHLHTFLKLRIINFICHTAGQIFSLSLTNSPAAQAGLEL